MSETSWVQFPYFEQASLNEHAELLGVERLAEPRPWLNETELSIIFEPLKMRDAIPATLVDEGKRTRWTGAFHAVREQNLTTVEYAMPPELKTKTFELCLREHNYMWDAQAFEGSAREAVLVQHESDTDTVEAVVAILVKDKDPTVQQLVIKGEEGWREPLDSEEDLIGSCLYIMHYLAINATNEATVDNRGETS